jgi:predicted membrane-bound spermidine synthase
MPSTLVQTGRVGAQSTAASSPHLKWYFAFFVVSGFCGLVYEVVWVRLAMASFGVTIALVSIVLSTFMAGLGLGSWGAGILTRQIRVANGPGTLRLYCLAELIIGSSAFLVPMELKLGRELILRMGGLGAWQSSRYYLIATVWLVITLIPWCTCLGSTFPLLMSVIRQSCAAASERSFSYLYAANVLGALLGTLVSAFVLIEMLGFQRTLWVSACMNALLAVLAFRMSFRLDATPPVEGTPIISPPVRSNLYGLPSAAILLLLFTSGLVSMGAEVVWMRQLTAFLGNWVYVFAAIVATYLVMTYLGARDYRQWTRNHRPNESAGIWSLLAVSVLIPLIGATPFQFFPGSYAFRLFSIALFCALTGFLTPHLVDRWSSGEPDRAGIAYAFNILGCIFGPLVASFWLEPWLGDRWSTLALSLPLFGIGAFLALRGSAENESTKIVRRSRINFVLAVIAAIVLLSLSSDFETQFPKRRVRRDYAATVVAAELDSNGNRNIFVNGMGMSALNPITKYMVHFPLALINRPPQNGLVICFGLGTSFRSMVSWGIPTTVVELNPSVPHMFSFFHADAPKVLNSPNARIVIDDGRRFLDGSDEKFDVITVDPPPPVAAPGSSLLYSREFYEVVKRHLRSGGVFQNWYPSVIGDPGTGASVTKTIMQSFPYVRAYRSLDGRVGIHFIASMDPLPDVSGSVLAARMPASAVSDFIEWGPKRSADEQFDLVLTRVIPIEELLREDPAVPVLTDDEPINEYFLLRRLLHASR